MDTLSRIAEMLGLATLVIGTAVPLQAQSPGNVAGWGWSGYDQGGTQPHFGWISINCENIYHEQPQNNCGGPNGTYGVSLDFETGFFSGYAWNGTGQGGGLGWIDFSPRAFPGTTGANSTVRWNKATNHLEGFARWLTLDEEGRNHGYSDWGWMQFDHEKLDTVTIDPATGKLSGYAWTGGGETPAGDDEQVGLGYLWFDHGKGDEPQVDLATGDVTGYAWESKVGWVKFSDPTDPWDNDVTVDLQTGYFSGYAWNEKLGWLEMTPNPFPDEPNYAARAILREEHLQGDPYGNYEIGDIVGWARIQELKEEGERHGYTDWGWLKLHFTRNDPAWSLGGSTFLDSLGQLTNEFHGYAYSGSGSAAHGASIPSQDETNGIGWIGWHHGKRYIPPTTNFPYVTTEGGPIYSQENVGDPETFSAPDNPKRFNAAYLILANGSIQQFETSATLEGGLPGTIEEFEKIHLPSTLNQYTNSLGRIDLAGLSTPGSTPGKNRYFHKLAQYTGNTLASSIPELNSPLDETVIVIDGDLTIDVPLEIKQSVPGSGVASHGLVIIHGNLIVEQNIQYAPTGKINDFRELPSIAWIANGAGTSGKGNIMIDPSVAQLAGVSMAIPDDQQRGGVIATGNTSMLQLVVTGLFLARDFNFQRSYNGTLQNPQPAERISDDGRLFVNPPPGLQDFAQTLPLWREVIP
jgi:hypothetical protein